ncbi:GntR family transcriptional regulator [Klugiella xanthotipulae]|uniref:GntR family transcriptional regulator n=1 Tax=Klugiella xanthotipulae TaxID=244735 RepID=A0A543I6C7_9MICO|nr:GntR family transcriptional regulator [Klugiella xanthotipulae]
MGCVTVYEDLRDLIVSGELDAHERTSELSLAERLGVSRTPVREALQRLDGDGLVYAQGRGVRVRRQAPHELALIYDARAALEGHAVEQAAHRQARGLLLPAALDSLDELADDVDAETRAGRLGAAIRLNKSFHLGVAALAHNPVIVGLLTGLWDQILVSTRQNLGETARVESVAAEHRDILRLVRAGDGAGARSATVAHIARTRLVIRSEEGAL